MQAHHFDSWPAGYSPAQTFNSIAGLDDVPTLGELTLAQVLGLGGGNGGLNQLMRHTVAALLNAASGSVSYGLTEGQIIDAFNAVYPGGNYETLKNMLDLLNNAGCPLD